MTGLLITAWIFFAILLLLLAPVSLRVAYRDGKFQLHMCYLFLKIDFLPETTSKKAKRKTKKVKKKEPRKAKKTEAPKKPGKMGSAPAAKEIIRIGMSVFSDSRKAMRRICKNLVFYKVEVKGRISAGDAHKTALKYGQITSATSILLSIVSELFVLSGYKVHLVPDFIREESQLEISFRVRIMPIIPIATALSIGVSVLKTIRMIAKENPKPTNKRKGGKTHEPAASHQ